MIPIVAGIAHGILDPIGHELVWKEPEDASVQEAEQKVEVIN